MYLHQYVFLQSNISVVFQPCSGNLCPIGANGSST